MLMSLWYDFWTWVAPTGPTPAAVALNDYAPNLLTLIDTGTAVLTLDDLGIDVVTVEAV